MYIAGLDDFTAVSGALPLNRCITSLEIPRFHTCAFFVLEACINPEGTHGMIVQGPAKLDRIPDIMMDSIQAYICGFNATRFAGNASLTAGTVIVDDLGRLAKNGPKKEEKGEARVEIRDEEYVAKNDGRGATIYKQLNLQGEDVPAKQTAIPGNSYCTDMNNIFGGWDGQVRSLVVEPNYKCQFYTDYGCPKNGLRLDLGSRNEPMTMSYLGTFDRNIHSAFCAPI
ncbi:hypothetical protein K469DRAFT_715330 [Zopfia rhizophila CBS 207.26]|uniref:Uncharacterized protein n=1 Tax=Zopfia rhizophila CBS 207.26 TaxID=1314779 RepID=A0A6A6ENW4_9PEZI|nr:hypothetical protein K469DRAFT_715330 [Zopfia rhizophila CBS 207.26]